MVMRRLDGAGIEGPLAPYGAGFARWLFSQGYTKSSVNHLLGLMGWLSRWLAQQDLGADVISEVVMHRFHAGQRQRAGGGRPCAAPGPLLAYLRGLGVAAALEPDTDQSVERCLLSSY